MPRWSIILSFDNILIIQKGVSFIIHFVEDLRPSEILFVKAVIQIAFFGIGSASIRCFCRRENQQILDNKSEHSDSISASMEGGHSGEDMKHGWKFYVTVTVTNFGIALIQVLIFAAVKLMPVSDFMVFMFSTPILDLLMSACILR